MSAGAGWPGSEEQAWSLLSHLSAYVLPVIGPAGVLLTAGRRSAYVRQHAADALDFQVTVVVPLVLVDVVLSTGLLARLPGGVAIPAFIVTFALAGLLVLALVVLPLRAIIRCSRGRFLRYPLAIRLASRGPRLADPGLPPGVIVSPLDWEPTVDTASTEGYAAWMRELESDLAPPRGPAPDEPPGPR